MMKAFFSAALAATLSSTAAMADESHPSQAKSLFEAAVQNELGTVTSIASPSVRLVLVPRGDGGQYHVQAVVNDAFACSAMVSISRFGTSVLPFPDAAAPLCARKASRSSISASSRIDTPAPGNSTLSCSSINRDLPAWKVEVSKVLPDGSREITIKLAHGVHSETTVTRALTSDANDPFTGSVELVNAGTLTLSAGTDASTRYGEIELKRLASAETLQEPLSCKIR